MKQGQSEWPIPFSDRAPIIDILPVKKSPATVLELPVKEEGSDEDMPEASWWDRSPLFLTTCRQLCREASPWLQQEYETVDEIRGDQLDLVAFYSVTSLRRLTHFLQR